MNFPDFTIRQGVVAAVYPGASISEMEEQVTKPLENYIFTYKEVKKEKTKSYTRNGLTIIQVELNDDIDGADKENFWSRFKLGVQQFKMSLLLAFLLCKFKTILETHLLSLSQWKVMIKLIVS